MGTNIDFLLGLPFETLLQVIVDEEGDVLGRLGISVDEGLEGLGRNEERGSV